MLNAVLTAGKVDVSSCDFWAIDADMSLMSPLGHTLMAWSSQVCVQHLAGLDWSARSELIARARGGYGGAPLQIRELAQRLLGNGPHVIVSSGDFLPPALGKAIETRFPEAKLHKIYGLTEVSGRLCVLPHPQRQLDPAAAGFPLPGFDVFTDATDDDKDIAEICVRGPTMMHGYWRPGGSFEPAAGSVFRTATSVPCGATVLSPSTAGATTSSKSAPRRSIVTALKKRCDRRWPTTNSASCR